MKRASSDIDGDDTDVEDAVATTAGSTNNEMAEAVGKKPPTSTIKAVLQPKYYESVTWIEAYADFITGPKYTSRLIKRLNASFPIPRLRHLKRVNGNRSMIIITTTETAGGRSLSAEDCVALIKKLVPDTTGLQLRPALVKLPGGPALTRAQYEEASELWPTLFREDKTVERLLSGEFLDRDELMAAYANMRLAIEKARANSSPVAALAHDPDSNRVLAITSDDRISHPAKHAVMRLIDQVAAGQGGGYWKHSAAEALVVSGGSSDNSSNNSSKCGPYLLTGYDVYVTREPCVMCAMALTHSRVRRVFYGCRSETGAVGTLCQIHSNPDLNHRYLVFSNVLANDCQSLAKYDLS